MENPFFSIHAHFYQPPRVNPLTGIIGSERDAAPYRNWNERAAEEVYRPNSKAGNYNVLSFDMSDNLLEWLHGHTPNTYDRIVKATQNHLSTHATGNALAVAVHQSPLPELSQRDRLTQLHWAADSAKLRYGYVPKGVFLPYFAVDDATLQDVVDTGFEYTILHPASVDGTPKRGGSGPYRIMLESGDQITAYIVNDILSESMLNEMIERGGAGYWARRDLLNYTRKAGKFTLLYIDGEQLGSHHMAEASFLQYLMQTEVYAAGFKPITLNNYHDTTPRFVADLTVRPYEPIACTDDQKTLKKALGKIMTRTDELYEESLGDMAWIQRDSALSDTPAASQEGLLRCQITLQSAWAGVFALNSHPHITVDHIFNDIAFACVTVEDATGEDLAPMFRKILSETTAARFDQKCEAMRQKQSAKTAVG